MPFVLSEEHAQLVAEAIGRDLERFEEGSERIAEVNQTGASEEMTEDAKQLGRVQVLLSDAVLNPAKYAPTGKSAATVRSIVRRAKGPAQPKPMNKRKARQERRIKTSKIRRKHRREIAENFNRSREIYEQEAREAEEFHKAVEERIAKQAKFRVTTADGRTVLAGIPAEFIINEETGENFMPKIIRTGRIIHGDAEA